MKIEKKIKKLTKPPNFDTLVDFHTREVHSLLLISGGRGLKSGICNAMIAALEWHREMEKYEANQKLIEKIQKKTWKLKGSKKKKVFRECGFP